jgi:hypothetical protein
MMKPIWSLGSKSFGRTKYKKEAISVDRVANLLTYHSMEVPRNSGVPGDSCTSRDEANWYERSLAWHEERNIRRSRL